MRASRRLLGAGCVLALLSGFREIHAAEAVSPLIGTWVACPAPGGKAKEVMEFYPEGYGFVLRPDRPRIPFLFKEAAEQVMLLANAGGELVTVYLKVGQGYGRLTAENEVTGSGAFYVRRGQEAGSDCTPK